MSEFDSTNQTVSTKSNEDHALVQRDKIEFIDSKFKVSSTVNHLHHLMTEVTKDEIKPETVNAACNCVTRMNETLDTVIKAAKFLNER